MSLADELADVRTKVEAALPAPVFHAIAGSIESLKATGIAERATGVGGRIGLPVLAGRDGAAIDLAAISSTGPIVLLFYRGGWCPYCDVTLRGFAKALPRIAAAGGTLVAVTPETAAPPGDAGSGQDLGFPIAIDRGNAFARGLGLVFRLPEHLWPLYRDIGIDLPARNGDDSHELPVPAIYVVETGGRIAWAHVDADFTARADPVAVIDALEALRASAKGTSGTA